MSAGAIPIAPGMYSYENGVRTALLEYGSGDEQYLLLRVPVNEAGGSRSDIVPYLVLNGRIVPPIDVAVLRGERRTVVALRRARQRGLQRRRARGVLEAALHRRLRGKWGHSSFLAKGDAPPAGTSPFARETNRNVPIFSSPFQEGLDFQPRGLRLNAISTRKLRAWHFEQRRRVQACLSVTFQPRMLASCADRSRARAGTRGR